MRPGLTWIIPLLSLVVLAACAVTSVDDVAEAPVMAGSSWKLDGLGGVAVVSGREPTIAFTEDGRINGSTGCNRFFGGYTQDGAALTFTGTGSTKMACMGDGLMAQEAAFLGVLSGAATLDTEAGDAITITGASGAGFVARPNTPPPVDADPALLLGAAWIVEDLNRGGVIDNSRLTLVFGKDGRVSGSTNCNQFGGTYEAAGSSVTFGPLMMTRRACLAPAMSAQEQRYASALTGTLTWIIRPDGALELIGDDEARVLLRR